MKIAVFSAKNFDWASFAAANEQHEHELTFFEPRLTEETAPLAEGFDAVCPFVNDQVTAPVIARIAAGGFGC